MATYWNPSLQTTARRPAPAIVSPKKLETGLRTIRAIGFPYDVALKDGGYWVSNFWASTVVELPRAFGFEILYDETSLGFRISA